LSTVAFQGMDIHDPFQPRIAGQVDGNAADVETITQVIADVEAGFNGKDVDLLTSHLTQDATVIDVSGRRLRRRNDIEIDARCKLATVLRDQFARYRVNEIAFLRPDIAIATVDVRATTQDGQPKGPCWPSSCSCASDRAGGSLHGRTRSCRTEQRPSRPLDRMEVVSWPARRTSTAPSTGSSRGDA
jgi:uncharacterized protein (TIGR02246 family)